MISCSAIIADSTRRGKCKFSSAGESRGLFAVFPLRPELMALRSDARCLVKDRSNMVRGYEPRAIPNRDGVSCCAASSGLPGCLGGVADRAADRRVRQVAEGTVFQRSE